MKQMFYSTDQAATILGVSESTLRRWRATGQGPSYVRFGPRTIRYQAGDLVRWLRAHNVQPQAD